MNDLVMTAKTIVQDQNQSNLFWPIRANVKGVLDQSKFEAKQATNDRRSPEVGELLYRKAGDAGRVA